MTLDEEREDSLLRSLRELPLPEAPDQRRAARAAFVEAFEAPWYTRIARRAARVAVAPALACIVIVYLSWAVGAASALMH